MARKYNKVANSQSESSEVVGEVFQPQEVDTEKVVEQAKEEVQISNKELMMLVLELQKQVKELSEKKKEEVVVVEKKEEKSTSSADRWVKLIHLLDNVAPLTTHIEISNRKIDFGRFGETLSLRLTDFEELFYKYRSWFENNVIGITSADEDLALVYGISCGDRLPINSAILNKIPFMDDKQLENLFKQLSQTHKDLIIRKWNIGYFTPDEVTQKYPKDPTFEDRYKINLLNELSKGGMRKIIEDLENKKK